MSQQRVSVTVARVQKRLQVYGRAVEERARQIVDNNFIQAEGYAKEKAPWTDRTGDARRSIQSADLSQPGMLSFWLYIGVEYGVWLELANQGKYRILLPTFTITENQIMKDFKKAGFIK